MNNNVTKDLSELESVLKANGVELPKGEEKIGKDIEDDYFAAMISKRILEQMAVRDNARVQNIVMCGMITDDPDHEAKFRKYKYELEKTYPNAKVWNPVEYVDKVKRWMFPFRTLTNDMALIICLRMIYRLSRKDGFLLAILPDCITSLGGMAEWKLGQAMTCKIERMEEVK